ncbi:Uncharacterised protein [Mycobacteroides abscessus subsp. abscessus]|nr:Uncharacterised protein [Mycobacteroides abscessus subsp. abscessus]
MLNVKETTELLRSEGIADSEETVIRWILDGKIRAKRTKDLNINFSIDPFDLATFIVEKKNERLSQQFGVDYEHWEKTFQENTRLKEKMEELEITLRIEQAKVRSLKKMVRSENSLFTPAPYTIHSLLGIEEDADKDFMKKELKKLLKFLHPDRGGDERLFKVFYEHYEKMNFK